VESELQKAQIECKRLNLENESYQKFINSEHESLFVEHKGTMQKVKDLQKANHNMRRDNLLSQKIEDLEKEIEELNPIAYTNPDHLK
jgi:hypothetical protein